MNLKLTLAGAALALLPLTVGCGSSGSSDGGGSLTPTVLSSTPVGGSTGAALNGNASVNFSKEMDPATINDTTFTLTSGPAAIPVPGTVIYSDKKATFWPAAHLASNTTYTATITTGAMSAAGDPLATQHTWSFTTGAVVGPALGVNLGTAGEFAILAKSGISTVPISDVTGDVGISPAAASFITGFSLILDASTAFSSSTQITGDVYAADYSAPTPAKMTTAVADMELALTDAAGRAPSVTELGAGDIGGMTLDAGVYKWGTGLLIPTNVTLDGSATDVWIFQIAQSLTVSSGARVTLSGGALPKNVFWQVSGAVEIGTTAHLEGVILCQTAIALRTGASINGRLLAQTAVDLEAATVVEPTQ